MSNTRRHHTTSPKPPALTGPEVAHISMSPLARFSMSLDIGIGVGMLVAGWLGSRSSRRGKVLLLGTGLNVVALLCLVLLPDQSTVLLFASALSLGLGLGASVLAFPLAEDAAPRGQTAFTVATVNTTGTVTGGVMRWCQVRSCRRPPLAISPLCWWYTACWRCLGWRWRRGWR